MHGTSYLLKLQIYHVILDEYVQVCPGMPKEVFETYISQKTVGVSKFVQDTFCSSLIVD